MTLEWEQVIVDAADPAALGRWGEQSWTTLVDPEGNEFCVLGARRS